MNVKTLKSLKLSNKVIVCYLITFKFQFIATKEPFVDTNYPANQF